MKKTYNKAFTIVELSIVIIVIALLIGSSISLGATRINVEKIKQTQQKMEVIAENMKRYISAGGNVIVNGVPCPAVPNVATTSQNFGVADSDCSDAAIYADATNTNVRVGAFPNRTLMLPDEYSFDGWNNKFTYAMDVRYDTGLELQGGSGTETNMIEVRSAMTGGQTITQSAIFVLISHGANGHGAWKKDGSTRIDKNFDGTHEDEKSNVVCGNGVAGANDCTNDAIFVIRPPSSNYDDFGFYKLRWQLIPTVTAGGIIRHPTAACNRPNPSGANQAYTCPTAPRNCVPAAMGFEHGANAGRFVDTAKDATCVSVNGCWDQYEARNETNTAVSSTTYRYMCVAPDGSPVLCRSTVSAFAAGTGWGAVEPWAERNATVTPNTGACIWWQY